MKLGNENLFTEGDKDTILSQERDERGKITGVAWLGTKDKDLIQKALWLHGTHIKLKSEEYEIRAYLSQYPYIDADIEDDQVDLNFEKQLLKMTLEEDRREKIKHKEEKKQPEEKKTVAAAENEEDDDY